MAHMRRYRKRMNPVEDENWKHGYWWVKKELCGFCGVVCPTFYFSIGAHFNQEGIWMQKLFEKIGFATASPGYVDFEMKMNCEVAETPLA
ncbi:unnamed protein product [Gongylonema pulchrum]|uniref:4Fe-4S ferredoxin-type domain-containing protein n=1 Tax=Gongylonema pulchrum TaxID=637853 RepID=A0A183DR42_9BILA|nr:unnamed protein product [Gongylonema pulchrum]